MQTAPVTLALASVAFACGSATPAGNATVTPRQSSLTVSLVGHGTGRVRSAGPSALDCGLTCTAAFPAGTIVVLQAEPSSGSRFQGWSGCSGDATGCTVTVSGDVVVTAEFEPVTPPAPASCSELMPPGPPAVPVRFQIQKDDPARDICVPGTSDGVGGLALQTLHEFPPGGSHIWFVARDASQFNPISLPSATLRGQITGFEGASWTAEPASGILAFDDGGHLVGGSELLKSFPLLVTDPRGGVVVANFPDTIHLGSVESYDASARLRWHVSARPVRTGAWPANGLIALGVDRRGNSLLVLGDAGAMGSVVRVGVWIDPLGNAGQPFVIGAISPTAGAALFARLGQGFFVRQITPSGNEWVGQIDALSTSVAPPPDWLVPERNALVQVIKSGAGYALLPPAGIATSPCEQQVSIFDASGLNCGSIRFAQGPDACVTAAITIGYDGTVIQQSPTSMAQQATVTSQTCTWQWWSAFLK